MRADLWEMVSERFNAWLAAAEAGRKRQSAESSYEKPEVAVELDVLTSTSPEGFPETPALVVEARETAKEETTVVGSGTAIGPYRIVSLLARGGMGDVYRATDERLHRDVAIKLLREPSAGEARRIDRFMQEARVTASLDHPHVVRVYDFGRFEQRAYLVAELLEGETLRERIARGPLAPDEVLRIGKEIATGLAAAHAAGLVHRDLKPENIFITRPGTTKILDFGIAKLVQDETVRGGFSTETGVLLGTAGYIAPEQIRRLPADSRADLFALGAVLFEMVTGERAFAREHLVESLHAILHDRPSRALEQRAGVPLGLAEIVRRLLQKEPDARFQSALEVEQALQNVDLTAVAVTPRAVRPWIWAAAAVLVIAVGGASLMMDRAERASPASKAALLAPVLPEQPLKLAIMPFRSTPPAEDRNALELGLAEVLISRLGQLANIQVLPISATQRLDPDDPARAAETLGADRVLVLTLQRDEDRVRAVPRLTSAAGELVWTTTVDTDATSMFSIQDIIVGKLVEELAPKLSAVERTKLARPGTGSNEAWEAYLRGRAAVLNVTGTELTRAEEAFEEALLLDPRYADAWGGLASTYKRVHITAGTANREALTKAKAAAERALEIDPGCAEALSVLGTVASWYEHDFVKAERLLRRALELQPSSADAQIYLSHLYSSLGRHDEALAEIRRARAFDPTWSLPRAHEGHVLILAGRYEDALRHLEEAQKVDPRFWPTRSMKLMALIELGRYDDAVREADAVAALLRSSGSQPKAWMFAGLKGYALARAGRQPEAEELLELIQRERASGHHVGEALILHATGRHQEAIARLRRTIDEREMSATFLGVHPWWDGLRQVPDFRDLLRETNLLEVSERTARRSRRSPASRPATGPETPPPSRQEIRRRSVPGEAPQREAQQPVQTP
jgi:eukaryotic-like serine/threonine-protein kinase